MSFRSALAIPAALLLAGCLNEPIAQRDPAVGEAVAYDAAIQTVNPDPVYPEGSAQPGDSGEHGAKAVERYRKGAVTPVQEMSTGSGSSGAGGGGGPP